MNKATPLKLKRVAIYVRVSTDQQDKHGGGKDVQRERILQFIDGNHERLEWHQSASYYLEEAETGTDTDKREKYKELTDLIKSNAIDVVVIHRLDRLHRNLKGLIDFFNLIEAHDVELISVKENFSFDGPMGSLLFHIFGAIGEFEHSLIQERTGSGIDNSAALGRFTSSKTPYGYKKVPFPGAPDKNQLEIIPEEAQVVQRIYRLYIDGQGPKEIMRTLNAEQISTGYDKNNNKRTAKWSEKMVSNILKNQTYRGEYHHKRRNKQDKQDSDYIIVPTPPIISNATYLAAQNKRANHGGKGRPREHDFLLSGKIIDMTNQRGWELGGVQNTKGDGHTYRRQKRKNPDTDQSEPAISIPGQTMDDAVLEQIFFALRRTDSFIKAYFENTDERKQKIRELNAHANTMRTQQAKLESERKNTLASIGKLSGVTTEEMNELLKDQKRDIEALKKQLKTVENQISMLTNSDDDLRCVRAVAAKFNEKLESLSFAEKKALVRIFVERINVRRTQIGETKKGRPRWKIQSEVILRFDKKIWERHEAYIRTLQDSPKKAHGDSNAQDSEFWWVGWDSNPRPIG